MKHIVDNVNKLNLTFKTIDLERNHEMEQMA